MVKREVVENHVDALLRKITGSTKLERDSDGSWPFPLQRTLMYVEVDGDRDPTVKVFAIGAHDLPQSPELFESLNNLNQSLAFCRALWRNESLIIATELVGETLDVEELAAALRRVATAADEFGPQIAATHGGETLFVEPPASEPDPASEPKPAGSGMYL